MNQIRRQAMRLFWTILLLSVGVALGRADDKVVAKVNGQSIRSSEIAVAKSLKPGVSYDVLEQALLERQKQKLRNQIRQIIFDEAVRGYSIVITDEEIMHRLNKSFSDAAITDDTAVQIKQKGMRIAESLKKVVVHRSDPEEVYSSDLENIISKQEWNGYLTSYDTPEKIQSLVELLPNNVTDMKTNSRASARNDLEAEKLDQRIYADLSVTDEDIASYCQQRLRKDPEKISPELRERIEKRILAERQKAAKREWWKKQITETDIEILDPRFEELKQTMLKELSETEDPRKRLSQRSRPASKPTE